MAGGGVGEAMLIGAAVGATAGGAGAAIQGGDPMKGALMGGAMGAVGGGLGGAGAGAGAGAVEGGTSGAAAGGAGSAVTPTATALAGSGSGAGVGTIGAASNVGAGISGVGAGSGTLGSAGFGTMSAAPSSGIGISAGAAPGAGISAGGAGGAGAANLGIAQGSALPAGGYSATGSMPPTTNVFGQAAGTPGYLSNTQLGMTGATAGLAGAMQAERDQLGTPPDEEYSGPLSKLKYDPNKFESSTPQYAPKSVYRPTYAAQGGIMDSFRSGGYNDSADYDDSVGTDDLNAGGIARFDMGGMAMTGMPSTSQAATQQQSQGSGIDALMGNKKRMMTKEQMDAIKMQGMSKSALKDIYGQMAAQGLASGGHLGGYSDGGRMLKGPGDGMSDNIPATIAGKQPARLADGEFVVPADVVSHLGNGSTDAGAKQLYSMMERVRKARTGNKKQGKQIKPTKYMVA